MGFWLPSLNFVSGYAAKACPDTKTLTSLNTLARLPGSIKDDYICPTFAGFQSLLEILTGKTALIFYQLVKGRNRQLIDPMADILAAE